MPCLALVISYTSHTCYGDTSKSHKFCGQCTILDNFSDYVFKPQRMCEGYSSHFVTVCVYVCVRVSVAVLEAIHTPLIEVI